MKSGTLHSRSFISGLSFVILLVCACEKPVGIEVSEFQKKLTGFAHIEAGSDSASVYISHNHDLSTIPVYNSIENINFEIHKDGILIDGIRSSTTGLNMGRFTHYTLHSPDRPFEFGSNYSIVMKTNGEYPDAVAEFTIPHDPPVISRFESLSSSLANEVCLVRLNDDPNISNFYHMAIKAIRYDQSPEPIIVQNISFNLEDTNAELVSFNTTYDNDWNALFDDKKGILFSDEFFNGMLDKDLNIIIPKEQFVAAKLPLDNWSYELQLYSVSESFYRFHESTPVQNEIFIGTPVPIYSNLTGGFGCFSAHNLSVKVLSP